VLYLYMERVAGWFGVGRHKPPVAAVPAPAAGHPVDRAGAKAA